MKAETAVRYQTSLTFLQARIANCSCTNPQHLTHTPTLNTLHTHPGHVPWLLSLLTHHRLHFTLPHRHQPVLIRHHGAQSKRTQRAHREQRRGR
jgi:hypothetical protein